MSRFLGRKSKIFLAVFIINGVFLFVGNLKTAQAYHATSSYNKLFNDTLTSQNWNDLFSDFANTWLPVSLNGPVGIATAAPTSGLDVNGLIKGTSMYSTGNVGFGIENPTARLSVVPASGYSILAGSFKIGNVALPTEDADAATKGYVDSFVASATSSISNLWGGNVVGNIWNLNSGNVGIGTTNPLNKLAVSNGGAGGIEINAGSSAFGLTNAGYILSYDRTGSTYRDLVFDLGGSAAESIFFKAGGNIGIGVANPSYALDMNAGLTTDTASINLGTSNNTGDLGGGILWRTHYSDYTKISAAIRQVGNGGYFRSDIAFYTGDYTSHATDAIERMRITKEGNVGIGTTTPTARLTVVPATGYAITTGGYKIGDVGLPTVSTDAANKAYVDANAGSDVWTVNGTHIYNSNTGNVGIGTTGPIVPLQVKGVIASANPSSLAQNVLIAYDNTTSSGNIEAWDTSTGPKTLTLNYRGGNVGIGTTTPATTLAVIGNLSIPSPTVPTTSTSTCVTGTISWDATRIFICVATNTWKYNNLGTW
jgi:hypothetical protein